MEILTALIVAALIVADLMDIRSTYLICKKLSKLEQRVEHLETQLAKRDN